MRITIFLLLFAIGFYSGRWVGAIGLVAIYFYFSQGRQFLKQQKTKARQVNQPMSRPADVSWAYSELGVAQSADEDSIIRARKRLLNHYHPDKLGQASDSEKLAAEKKVNDINRAFSAIKQHKAF